MCSHELDEDNGEVALSNPFGRSSMAVKLMRKRLLLPSLPVTKLT